MTTVNVASVGNTAQHCRLGFFQDSDFAGALRIKFFRSQTFVSISWMCKKRQHRTVLQSLKSYLSMLDCVWTVYPLLICGTMWWMCCAWRKVMQTPTSTAHGEPQQDQRLHPNVNKQQPIRLISQTWIKCLWTHTLLRVHLVCTFLRTMKLLSRWS